GPCLLASLIGYGMRGDVYVVDDRTAVVTVSGHDEVSGIGEALECGVRHRHRRLADGENETRSLLRQLLAGEYVRIGRRDDGAKRFLEQITQLIHGRGPLR